MYAAFFSSSSLVASRTHSTPMAHRFVLIKFLGVRVRAAHTHTNWSKWQLEHSATLFFFFFVRKYANTQKRVHFYHIDTNLDDNLNE